MTEHVGGAWHDGVVTVPTPSSHNRAEDGSGAGASGPADPWGGARRDGHGGGGADEPLELRQEMRDGALCALAVTVLGVALGLLWLWLAPRIPLFTDGKAVYLKDPEGEEAIGADGTFVLLALGFGLVSGVVAFLCRRAGSTGAAVGLAVGALLGSVVAWRIGVWLGPPTDVVAAAKAAGTGKTFGSPLELRSKAALLAWPIGAVLVNMVLVGVFGPREEEPQLLREDGW